MSQINKVIDVLSVLNTDRREEAISSIIQYTIYSLNQPTGRLELLEYMNVEFGLSFNLDEVSEIVDGLVNSNQLTQAEGKYQISSSVKNSIESKKIDSRSSIESGFAQFKKTIAKLNYHDINEPNLEQLYRIFLDYLYECFYEYGRTAINLFRNYNPEVDQENLSRSRILDNALNKIPDPSQKSVFESYVKIYPKELTSDQEAYLESLVDKTEYIFALGLPRELFEVTQNINPFELELLLDTNVLLSVLDLREHPSNEACQKLVQLVKQNENQLKVFFKYTASTHRELLKTKSEIEDLVRPAKFKKEIISAALKSERLDSYTQSYYRNLSKYGINAAHPADKLKRSIEILKGKGIEIDRNEYKEVSDSESFKDKLSSYNQFQRIKNEARLEKNITVRLDKDITKVEHDVLLREIVLTKRRGSGLNDSLHVVSSKYFGITLDKRLIEFDRYYSRRPDQELNIVPVFFNPSYLLKKLYKVLPIESSDYRQAFLKAISSPVFKEESRQASRSIQDTVKYFQALGIDDETFIVQCLTDDVFLDEIKRRENEEEEEVSQFIENALSKEYKIVLEEKQKKEAQLQESEEQRSKLSIEKSNVDREKTVLQQERNSLKTDVHNLDVSVKSLSKQLSKIQKREKKKGHTPLSLDLYKAERDQTSKDNEALKSELEKQKVLHRNDYYKREIRKWQKNSLSILATVTIVISVLSYVIFKNGYFVDQDDPMKEWYLIGIGIAMVVLEWFVIRTVWVRFQDHKNIEAFKNSLDLPEELQ